MRLAKAHPSTFSIVGYDADTGDLGVAVQSKFLAVGAVVPWAKAGIGAIATQSYANTSYGPQGLTLLAQGHSAQETIEILTKPDKDKNLRQVGVVTAQGDAASFTGSECHEWAGGLVGKNFCCQGNILVGAATVKAMGTTFQNATGTLADRLLAALAAGQAAGGDRRGQQSACVLVVREKGGYGGYNDTLLDLRVDDHPQPIDELIRLHQLHKLYFEKAAQADLLKIDAELATELQQMLSRLGYYAKEINGSYNEATQGALWDFCGVENLEERWREGALIDPAILKFLQDRAKTVALP